MSLSYKDANDRGFTAEISLPSILADILVDSSPLGRDRELLEEVVEEAITFSNEVDNDPAAYISIEEIKGLEEGTALHSTGQAIINSIKNAIRPYLYNYITDHEGKVVYLDISNKGITVLEGFFEELKKALARVRANKECVERVIERLRKGVKGEESLILSILTHKDVDVVDVKEELARNLKKELEEMGIKVKGSIKVEGMQVKKEKKTVTMKVKRRIDTSKVEIREELVTMAIEKIEVDVEDQEGKVTSQLTLEEFAHRLAERYIDAGNNAFSDAIAKTLSEVLALEAYIASRECGEQ